MTVEIMLLAVLCAVTLLAYMIAINAHGPVRLSLSYLLATIMLAGTVWAIVQFVNSGYEAAKAAELQRLEKEKVLAEREAATQSDSSKTNKGRLSFTVKLNIFLTSGTAYATSMVSIDLQDKNATLDALMARAVEMKRKCDVLRADMDLLKTDDQFFNEPLMLIRTGITFLGEAAYYYKSYYYSEDSQQEQDRERLLRVKAKAAFEKFQRASTILAAIAN